MVVRKVSARFKTPLGFEEWDVVFRSGGIDNSLR